MSDFTTALLASSATASPCLQAAATVAPSPLPTLPVAAIQSTIKRYDKRRDGQPKFVLFIDTLMKYLKIQDPDLALKATQTIKYCTRLNRQGDRRFIPLKRAITSRLRHLVGDIHWARILAHYQDVYLIQQSARARRRDSLSKLDSLQLLCNRISSPDPIANSPTVTAGASRTADELKLLALTAQNQLAGSVGQYPLPRQEPLPFLGASPFSKLNLHQLQDFHA